MIDEKKILQIESKTCFRPLDQTSHNEQIEFIRLARLGLEYEGNLKKGSSCSHGDYKSWGTVECGSCMGGRVMLYYFGNGTCFSCENIAQPGKKNV